MILSRLYHTDIDCNKYNLRINETINVTITLTDFNEMPVKNTQVNVSCSNGTLSNNNGITNSNGQVILTYTPAKWGIDTIHCNGTSIQVNVRGGWKDISVTKNHSGINTVTAQYNQDMVKIYLQGTIPSSTAPVTLATLNDTNFAPFNDTGSPSHVQYGQIFVRSNGAIHSIVSASSTNWWGCYYPRKVFYD